MELQLYLSRSGLPTMSLKKNFLKSHMKNPLLTKFVRSRWLDIGPVLFCEFMELDSVSVHKHANKELGKYPAILTSHLVNNPYYTVATVGFFTILFHRHLSLVSITSATCMQN